MKHMIFRALNFVKCVNIAYYIPDNSKRHVISSWESIYWNESSLWQLRHFQENIKLVVFKNLMSSVAPDWKLYVLQHNERDWNALLLQRSQGKHPSLSYLYCSCCLYSCQ